MRFDNSERMCITMADVKQNNVIRVSAKSVWPTSDKAVCIIGLRDWLSADNGGSANGFLRVPVPSSAIMANQNEAGGSNSTVGVRITNGVVYDVIRQGEKGADGKPQYEHTRTSGSDLIAGYHQSMGHMEKAAVAAKESFVSQTAASSDKQGKAVYLNNVPARWVQAEKASDGSTTGRSRVFVPNGTSPSGWGVLVVDSSRIYQAKRKDGTVIPGYMNIALGKECAYCASDFKQALEPLHRMQSADIATEYNRLRQATGKLMPVEQASHASERKSAAVSGTKFATQAVSKSKAETVYLNNISSDSVKSVLSSNGKPSGKSYVTVLSNQSPSGVGTIIVDTSKVYQSKRKDGTVIPGRLNVALGPSDGEIPYVNGSFEKPLGTMVYVPAGDIAKECNELLRQAGAKSRIHGEVGPAQDKAERDLPDISAVQAQSGVDVAGLDLPDAPDDGHLF